MQQMRKSKIAARRHSGLFTFVVMLYETDFLNCVRFIFSCYPILTRILNPLRNN